MSFQDPPRRQRPPRYPAPALAQYEDDPRDDYQGFAGLADTPRQRPPWDDPQQRSVWDSGAQQSARDTGGQRSLWDTGAQQTARNTGAHRLTRNTGGQMSARNTGAHRATAAAPAASAWNAPAWDASAQETSWDLAGQQIGGGLPRRTSGPLRTLSEDDQGPPRGARPGNARRRGRSGSRGLLAGGVTGFLAAAVALGVANLVAAFVRPQASPIIAVGEAFIDRTPSALKNFAVAKFGENDKNMLLLGMYVTIALIAIAIGALAWRRLWIGVAGIGLFGLFGAFVAITRPDSHVTDVIPSVVGGIAGIAAIVLLVQAGLPRTRAALRTRPALPRRR